ncbi:MAG TPA: transcription antitermination factor NusB [Alphaproteobacteria bacterium]
MVERPDKIAAEGKSPANVRRLSSARLAAVQAIYQMEMSDAGADTVVTEFFLHREGAELGEGEDAIKADKAFFAEIVRGVAEERAELDRLIGSALVEGWPLARIEKVMAAAMRAGTYELLHRADVPARVVVSEYVDVAHAFFEGKEIGMVNGVLDRLARVLREAEMAHAAIPDPLPK